MELQALHNGGELDLLKPPSLWHVALWGDGHPQQPVILVLKGLARGMVSVPGIVDVNISSRWLLVVISLSAGDVQVEHVITPLLPMK